VAKSSSVAVTSKVSPPCCPRTQQRARQRESERERERENQSQTQQVLQCGNRTLGSRPGAHSERMDFTLSIGPVAIEIAQKEERNSNPQADSCSPAHC